MNQSTEKPAGRRLSLGAYRRLWLPEMVLLLLAAGAATAIFASPAVDLAACGWFFRAASADHWPLAPRLLWYGLYRSTPVITGLLAALGCTLVLAGFTGRRSPARRWHGVFVLLAIAIGPGIIVNSVLKDHWGRPRPRDLAVYGGTMTYVAPWMPSRQGGKSFPCGHCSVGFLYATGWWIWRRTHPRRAAASLAAGLALGALLGAGRLAAGGHFVSDTVWAGLIALGTAHVLYYHVLRIPAREDSDPRWRESETAAGRPGAFAVAVGVVVAALVASGVLMSWRFVDLTSHIPLRGSFPPSGRLEVVADRLEVEIHLVDEPATDISVSGDIHGFALPGARIEAGWAPVDPPDRTLRYRVTESGHYLYLDATAEIRLPLRAVRVVSVRTGRGRISVVDDTHGASAHAARPGFDLHSGAGRVTGLPP